MAKVSKKDFNLFSDSLLNYIKAIRGQATESDLLLTLHDIYENRAFIYFNDAIRLLEAEGKIVRMTQSNLIWWEAE